MQAEDQRNPAQERKKQERKQRIQYILKVAKRVFLSKGYLGATVDEIAYQAGFSKPTLYQYFQSKDDLFVSLIIPLMDDVGTKLKAIETSLAEGAYDSGADLIRSFFKMFRSNYESDPESFGMLTLVWESGMAWQLSPKTRSTIFQKGKDNYEITRKVLQTAMEKRLLREANVYYLADILIGGLYIGVVQTVASKSNKKKRNKNLSGTLEAAEELLISAIAL